MKGSHVSSNSGNIVLHCNKVLNYKNSNSDRQTGSNRAEIRSDQN